MGKVDRLHIKVKHFVALIFANLTLTLPAGPASLHRPTGSMTIYCKDMLGSILFPTVSRYVIYCIFVKNYQKKQSIRYLTIYCISSLIFILFT